MAVTPNYSWPVPVNTDYVKDGAEAIKDLGDAIDATVFGLPSGAVVQVLSSVNTSTFSTTNSATWTDVTSLSVTITPSATTSKIRLTAIVNFGHSANVFTAARFMRDATAIGIGDDVGYRIPVTSGNYQGNAGTTQSLIQVPLNFIDSPASISAITYKVQVYQNEAGTLYVNRNTGDANNGNNMRAISTLIVEEIGV